MSKETKKNPDKYVPQVISTLQEKYGLSSYYIRQCVAAKRQGIVPDKIRREYKSLTVGLEKALEEFKNN